MWIYLVDHSKWGHSNQEATFIKWNKEEGMGGEKEACAVTDNMGWKEVGCEGTSAFICER